MTHTWSTDSYAIYPQIHPGKGGGGWLCEWLGQKKGLAPTRGPPLACQLTGGWCHYKCRCIGSRRGSSGVKLVPTRFQQKGEGGVFHLSRHPSFSGASLDWAAPLLSVGFGCWSYLEELMLGPVSCLQASSDKKSDWGQRLRSRPRRPRQTAPASATGRPTLV